MLEYDFIDKTKYKKGLENDLYSLIISIMILPNHLEFEKFIEELNVLYKEIEKYCKYNLFEVIGVTQYDLEKLYTLNRLLKAL